MLQAMLAGESVPGLQKERRAAAKAEKKKARKNVRQAMGQVTERIAAELAASESGNGSADLRRRWMENQRTAVESLGFDRHDHRFAAVMSKYEAMGFFGNDHEDDLTANRAHRDYNRQPLTEEEAWSGNPARRAYRMPEFLWQFFYSANAAGKLPQASAAAKKRAAEAKERGNAQLVAKNLESPTWQKLFSIDRSRKDECDRSLNRVFWPRQYLTSVMESSYRISVKMKRSVGSVFDWGLLRDQTVFASLDNHARP